MKELREKKITINLTKSEYKAVCALIPMGLNPSTYCRIEILQRIKYESNKPTKTGRKK